MQKVGLGYRVASVGLDAVAVAVADAVRLRTVDTPLTSGGDLALVEAQLRPEMFDRLRKAHIQDGVIVAPQMTEAQARAYLDGAFGQARLAVGDDINHLRVKAALGSRDGAVEAYARFGERIFNPDGSFVDDLVEFGRSCKVAASFGAATLVVMADGSRVRIDEISVGDQVLAWDIDAGVTVVESVTATLPHTDTLYTANMSDGSTLLVTEDHLFFDADANTWVELADFSGEPMQSPDGVTTGLDEFVWSTSGPSQAYDLTVDEVHNYFVAADMSSTPVLVHNANNGWTCTRAAAHLIDADPSLAGPLKALDDALDPAVADELGAVVSLLDELDPALADRLLLSLAQPDQIRALPIAGNAAIDVGLTSATVRADLIDEILGGSRFADLSGDADQISTFVVRTGEVRDLTDAARRGVAARVFESNRAEAFVELVVRDADRATAVFRFVDANSAVYGSMVDDAVAIGTPFRVGYVDDVVSEIGPGQISGQLNDILTSRSNFEGELLENLNAVHRARGGDNVRFNAEGGLSTGPNGQTPPRPTANPEYWVDDGASGSFVDALVGSSPGSADSYIATAKEKIASGQAQRVDIVLDRFGNNVTIDEVEQAFRATDINTWVTDPTLPRPGIPADVRLVELTVLKDGTRRQIYFEPELAG